jgi:hypothetical protein
MNFFSNLNHSSNTDFLKNIPHPLVHSTFSICNGFLNGITLNHHAVTNVLSVVKDHDKRNNHILLANVICLDGDFILATHHLASL